MLSSTTTGQKDAPKTLFGLLRQDAKKEGRKEGKGDRWQDRSAISEANFPHQLDRLELTDRPTDGLGLGLQINLARGAPRPVRQQEKVFGGQELKTEDRHKSRNSSNTDKIVPRRLACWKPQHSFLLDGKENCEGTTMFLRYTDERFDSTSGARIPTFDGCI